MQKINKEKGITLIALAVTVVVLMLISIPIVVNTTEVIDFQRYTYFKGDIDKLREAINSAYADSQVITTIGPKYTGDISFLNNTQNGENVKNPNDNQDYYVISLKELNSHLEAQIDLKYGEGNKIDDYASLEINQGKDQNDTSIVQYEYQGNDTYIINAQTKTIYYTDGVEYDGERYYRLPEDFTEVPEVYTVTYDANGGTTTPSMQSAEATGTERITLRTAPQRDGYTFTGWKKEDSDTIYQAGQQYTVTENTKFIAQWEKN